MATSRGQSESRRCVGARMRAQETSARARACAYAQESVRVRVTREVARMEPFVPFPSEEADGDADGDTDGAADGEADRIVLHDPFDEGHEHPAVRDMRPTSRAQTHAQTRARAAR